jgi:hypothetical protein
VTLKKERLPPKRLARGRIRRRARPACYACPTHLAYPAFFKKKSWPTCNSTSARLTCTAAPTNPLLHASSPTHAVVHLMHADAHHVPADVRLVPVDTHTHVSNVFIYMRPLPTHAHVATYVYNR